MTKNHLKRLNAPITWNVLKRANVFITRANPGGHSMEMGVPIVVAIRDMLNITKTLKETISLLRDHEVELNGKRVRDRRQQIGLMDVLTFKDSKKNYRVVLSEKGKLALVEIKEGESKKLPLQVIGKTKLKGNKMQLNLFGGKNTIVDKDTYKVGDTIVVDSTSNKITDHFRYEKGMTAILIGGNHIGTIGTIEDVRERNIIYKSKDGEVFETLKGYAYIIG